MRELPFLCATIVMTYHKQMYDVVRRLYNLNKTCHRDRTARLTAPCPSHKKTLTLNLLLTPPPPTPPPTPMPVSQFILPPGQVAPRGASQPWTGCPPGGNLSRDILPPTLVIFTPGGWHILAGLSCPPGVKINQPGYLAPHLSRNFEIATNFSSLYKWNFSHNPDTPACCDINQLSWKFSILRWTPPSILEQ